MVAPQILIRRGARYPDGPGFARRVLSAELFRQSAADFMLNTARRYGDLTHYTGFGRHIFQFNHPQFIEELLLRDAGRHHRGVVNAARKDGAGGGTAYQ